MTVELSRAEMLSDISSKPVLSTCDWSEATLMLPYGCSFAGEIYEYPEGRRVMTMKALEVNPALRRAGIASRLVSALSWIAITNKVDGYTGFIDSPSTPGLLAKLFGDQRVDYEDTHLVDGPAIPLPITADLASQIIRSGQANNPDYGLHAGINLDGLNVSKFERPVGDITIPGSV